MGQHTRLTEICHEILDSHEQDVVEALFSSVKAAGSYPASETQSPDQTFVDHICGPDVVELC